jgi:hypothetical protein
VCTTARDGQQGRIFDLRATSLGKVFHEDLVFWEGQRDEILDLRATSWGLLMVASAKVIIVIQIQQPEILIRYIDLNATYFFTFTVLYKIR